MPPRRRVTPHQPKPYDALPYTLEARAHGTSVLDVAAGNGWGTKTPGVAPNADLIFVELDGEGLLRHPSPPWLRHTSRGKEHTQCENPQTGHAEAGSRHAEIPNLLALNFMLHDSLGGGGTESLKTDAQGKTHAQGMLLLEIEVPDEIAARLPHREHQGHG